MRFTALLYVLFVMVLTPAVRARAEDGDAGAAQASIDLATRVGVDAVKGAWRYSDVELVPTQHRAPDANGQPTGNVVNTWDYAPHAGGRDFDDKEWQVLDPTTLAARRGNGRISFNWYRIAITIPEAWGISIRAARTSCSRRRSMITPRCGSTARFPG